MGMAEEAVRRVRDGFAFVGIVDARLCENSAQACKSCAFNITPQKPESPTWRNQGI